MSASEKQKQSLYFPEEMLREIMREANRLDRSLSWAVQQAWRVARGEVKKFPSAGSRAAAQPVRQEQGPRAADARPSAQVLEFLKGKFDSELTN